MLISPMLFVFHKTRRRSFHIAAARSRYAADAKQRGSIGRERDKNHLLVGDKRSDVEDSILIVRNKIVP